MPAQRTAHGVNRIARSQSAEYVLGIQHGKHFCRVFDSAISYANIIDYGLEMWARQEWPEPEVNDPDSEYSQTCFLALEKMYDTNKGRRSNKKLKEELRDEITGQVFRGNFCAGLGKGHGQGKCDDLSELKQLPVRLKVTGSGYNGHTMEILMTSSLLANDSPELREQLRAGDLDASHSELYAGLYIGNKFPTDPANPFEGFMRSDLFVAALQTIFTGPGSAIGAAGSGERSKASKNGMTSLTLASLAHVATLLRFALHSPGKKWYRVKNTDTDHRFDYDMFYSEVITYLEAAGFEADCAELLAHLNRIVFPNTHLHPRRINVNAGPSSMAQIAANARAARAQQAANPEAEVLGAEDAGGGMAGA